VRLTAYSYLWNNRVEQFSVKQQVDKFERFLEAKNIFQECMSHYILLHPNMELRLANAHCSYKERLTKVTIRWLDAMQITSKPSLFEGVKNFFDSPLVDIPSLFYKGIGCLRNHVYVEQGKQLIIAAANLNFAPALSKLAGMYATGVYMEKNIGKAIEYYEKAIDRGNVVAMVNLANLLLFDEKLKDYSKAFSLAKKASAARLPEGHYMLGYFYGNGIYVKQDIRTAISFYKLAAKCGEINAKAVLGYIYGDQTSVHFAPTKAFKWSLRAARKGFDPSQVYVGYCYLTPIGVKQNVEKAFFWTKKAADEDNPIALNNLGCLYELGIGTHADKQEAMRLYGMAAEMRNETAVSNLKNLTARLIQENKDKRE